MDTIQSGLVVSAIGLVVTFTALGIFIGVIVLLQKLFPVKPAKEEKAITNAAAPVSAVAEEKTDSDEVIVAALAAAAYMRLRRSDQLGSSLMTGPGPYRTFRN